MAVLLYAASKAFHIANLIVGSFLSCMSSIHESAVSDTKTERVNRADIHGTYLSKPISPKAFRSCGKDNRASSAVAQVRNSFKAAPPGTLYAL
jgi:hypothetical protein